MFLLQRAPWLKTDTKLRILSHPFIRVSLQDCSKVSLATLVCDYPTDGDDGSPIPTLPTCARAWFN